MVDRKGLGLVRAGLFRVVEAADVENIRHWILVCGRAGEFALVKFVVEEQVLLPVGVEDPTLVAVAGADIGGSRNDDRRIDADFVGHVVAWRKVSEHRSQRSWHPSHLHSEGVFVVAVADITAVIPLVRAAVNDALGIVDVSILTSTSWTGGI